jgi:uncharacterized membrane protein YdbT with pleckstrin-like domain
VANSDWDASLLNDEKVLFETEKHWAAPLWDSWVAILMILGSLVVAWLATDQTNGVMGFVNRVLDLLRLGLFLGGLAWIGYNIVNWRTAKYAVTNLRVLGHEGLVRARQSDTLLSTLSDVRVKVPAVGKMLGFGDVTILTSSGGAGTDTFTTVRKVDEFKKVIFEQKTAQGDKQIDRLAGAANSGVAATASAAASSSAAAAAALGDLAKLRDSGAITPAEYDTKKAELLARI